MSKIEKLVEELSTLTVMEAAELSKALEEKWGVTAVAAAAPAAAGGAAEAVAEQTEFDVVITSVATAVPVIKEIRAMTGLGLTESKALTTELPKIVKSGVSKAEAEEMKTKLEAAGAKVELK